MNGKPLSQSTKALVLATCGMGVLAGSYCIISMKVGRLMPTPPRQRTSQADEAIISLGSSKSMRIDLGQVEAGGKESRQLQVGNPGRETIEIAAIETSCPCVQFTLDQQVVPGNRVVGARLTLDLSDDPQSAGDLAILVQGRTANGRVVLSLTLLVSVRRGRR